jgi:fructose-1,6-bisphosphatase/inositol monophosphatase family enzyme
LPYTIHGLHDAVASLLRRVSAKIVLPRYRNLRDGDIVEKAPGEIATIVDHESERQLTDGLLKLDPTARVVGEEACEIAPQLLEALDQGLVWIVDPLDGTPNYAAGRAPFGIIVALAEEGTTIAGWLYDPLADRLCFATKGGGAWVSYAGGPAERLVVAAPPDRPVASLATQFMPAKLREEMVQSAERSFELRPIPRCAAEHYPRLCLGENHVALFQRTLPWDHAAGALLLTEAGGKVSRWDGSPYCFHDDRLGIVAASSPALWQAAMTTLIGDGLNPAPHRHRVSRSTS